MVMRVCVCVGGLGGRGRALVQGRSPGSESRETPFKLRFCQLLTGLVLHPSEPLLSLAHEGDSYSTLLL